MPIRHALAALSIALGASAQAATFSGTYFFGDSLSDSGAFGGGKFTTNPGLVWTELLAGHYGQSATPVNPLDPTQGTNFAMGGAQVNTTPGFGQFPTTTASSVQQQVDAFQAAHPVVDERALYSVWGGANDIFNLVQFAGTLKGAATAASLGNFALAQQMAGAAKAQVAPTVGPAATVLNDLADGAVNAADNNSAAGLAGLAQQASSAVQLFVVQAGQDFASAVADLKQGGARYIVVPNLPDMGAIPGANVGADDTARAETRATFSALSSLYNTTVNSELKRRGIEVIFVNINGIMKEIMADPARYGIVNTTGKACNTVSSLICTPATLNDPLAPETWFFADDAHPTSAVHRMIAQYTQSVIEAPQQIALLPQAGLQLARDQRINLADRLQLLRNQVPTGVQLYVDARHMDSEQDGVDGSSGVDGQDHMLGVGGERALGASGWTGFSVHFSAGKHDFGQERGSFDLNEMAFTLYAGASHNGLYGQAYTQLGITDYNDVTRRIDIGTATRLESGDARGHRFGLGLDLGYDMVLGPVRTGPTAGLHSQRLFVGEFQERGSDSLAMNFGSQKVSSLTGSLGWSVTLGEALGEYKLQPYATVALQKEFDNDEREVRGGLSSTGSMFTMPVSGYGDEWVDWRVGSSAAFGRWQTLFSVGGSSGMEQGSALNVGLNVSTRF